MIFLIFYINEFFIGILEMNNLSEHLFKFVIFSIIEEIGSVL